MRNGFIQCTVLNLDVIGRNFYEDTIFIFEKYVLMAITQSGVLNVGSIDNESGYQEFCTKELSYFISYKHGDGENI